MPLRFGLTLAPIVSATAIWAAPAAARPDGAVLHEPIPPDPREDLALHVALDGDLPAALLTSSGIVSAPDPRRVPGPWETSYGPGSEKETFKPDRDTRRPDVGAYDDPFTPGTAPFKRLDAFDGVRSDYTLYVRDEHLVPMSSGAVPGPGDDVFYADLVVDVDDDRGIRLPSVGPGARIVRARFGVGSEDVPMRVLRDGADNWFLQAYAPRHPFRGRLVAEIAIAREAFGGTIGDPAWTELPFVAPLPENVAREAALVRSAIGVHRRMRPRQALTKLVQYFREFTDSDDPPPGRGSVYLDLALSRKGVCRHRAFAFLVTALSLGIPARMVLNEAHAWVEVHDGTRWRRIDLGGAGRLPRSPADAAVAGAPYEPAPEPFPWPRNSARGGDMVVEARGGSPADEDAGALPVASLAPSIQKDDRPPSAIAIDHADADARRGGPLHVRGRVRADGRSCPHVPVEVWLRAVGSQNAFLAGTVASDDDGSFAGGIVVPSDAALGDYDVIARTPGDVRCGAGRTDAQ
jgi:transglutaminase-like putative cysteine protease